MDQQQLASSGCPKKASMRWTALPQHQIDQILHLRVHLKWRQAAIAKHLHLPELLVKQFIHERHLQLPASGGRPSTPIPPEVLTALMLGQEGYAGLSRVYGVSLPRLCRLARRIGAPSPKVVRRRIKQAKQAQIQAERRAKPRGPRGGPRPPVHDYQRWRDLWAAGYKMKQIAAACNVPTATVNAMIYFFRCKRGWFPAREVHKRAQPSPWLLPAITNPVG